MGISSKYLRILCSLKIKGKLICAIVHVTYVTCKCKLEIVAFGSCQSVSVNKETVQFCRYPHKNDKRVN